MSNQVIWITASAGAGKTTALIKRYEELLRTHKSEQVVGITFTINAAKEMCERLSVVRDDNVRVDNLRIQTIHSLCHQILSTHAGKNVRILDPHEKGLLIQQATRMALDEPTELTKILAGRFSGYHLQNVVEKVLEKWRPSCHPREELCTESRIHKGDKVDPRLREDDRIPPPLAEQLCANYIEVFLTKTGEVRKRILDAATAKQFPDLVPIMAEEAQRVYAWQQEQAVQDWLYENAIIHQLVERVWAHYQTLKQDQKDYDELLSETQILLEDDVARYDICKNIHHVLLDEAQDTNPKQWRIIELLTQHLFDDPSANKSFFVVGDHKQSIYGFQNARPEFMEAQKQKYKTWTGEGFVEQALDTNYRSVKEVCEYVHTVCHARASGNSVGSHDFLSSPFQGNDSKVQVARPHTGFVLEVPNFDEALAKFLADPPFLPSQARPLELRDIMILCRKRDKTYQGIIERYGDQVRYEQTQLLSDLPDIQYLMHKALLMADPENSYAKYRVLCHPREERSDDSRIHKVGTVDPRLREDDDSCALIKLITNTLQHNQPLLDLILKFIAQHTIATPKSLYWWLRAYPYSLKTTSTDDPNTMHLLTMHGAKGLQAPVVFVFNDWSPYHQQDIWWNHDTLDFVLPPAKTIHHPTLTTIRDQNIKHQTAEDARLRYVAFTRAMDVLVVVTL